MLMQMMSNTTGVKRISAGGHHSLILMDNGQLFSFGYESHGQLGHKNTLNYFEPKLIKDLVD